MEGHRTLSADRQAAYVIFGKLTALVVTLTIPLLLTRYLSKDEYGIYAQFNTITLFITGIFSFGIQTSLYYFIPNEKEENQRIFKFQTFLVLIISSLLAILLFSVPTVSQFLIGGGKVQDFKLYIIWGIALIMPTLMIEPDYVVSKNVKMSLLYPPFQAFAKILLLLFTLFFFAHTINNILNAIVVSLALILLFSYGYLIGKQSFKIGFKTWRMLDLSKLLMQLRYSIPFGFAVVLSTVITRIDKLLCIKHLSASEYAIYSIAFLGIPGIQQIYDSLSQVIIVKIVEAIKSGNNNLVLQLYKQLTAKTFSYTIPLIIIIAWYAKDIITFLFTIKYADATPFFQLYLLSFVIGMLGAGVIIRSTGKTKLTLKAYLIAAIIVIPLAYILIPKYGMIAAITTALLGAFIPKLVMIYLEMKVVGCKLKDYFPWKNFTIILLISLTCIIPLFIIDYLLARSILLVATTSIIYISTVFALEIKFGVFVLDRHKINTFILKIYNSVFG